MRAIHRSLASVLALAALAWLISARPRREPTNAEVPFPNRPTETAGTATAPPLLPAAAAPVAIPAQAPSLDGDTLRPPPLELSTGLLPWERQIADAAQRGRDAAGQAREILALLPRLPAEALSAAAEQAIEHLPNADHATTALPVLADPRTDGQVLSVLFADLMERPDTITLPALLTLAQHPAHPFAPAALDNLRLLLRADFGRDWRRWEQAIQTATTRSDR